MKKQKNKIFKFHYIIIILLIVYNFSFNILNLEFIHIAKSDNMKGKVNKYDALILKQDDYKVGDIVVYNYNGSESISEVISKNKDNLYDLKATNELYIKDNIPNEDIIGKVTIRIPILGIILNFLRSKIINIILVIYLTLALIINNINKKKSIERREKRG